MHFDFNISLGNILTILSLIGSVAVHSIQVRKKRKQHQEEMEARQQRHDEDINWIKQYITAHQSCHKALQQMATELAEGVAFLKGKVSTAQQMIPDRRN
jgi:hypothetical protein